MTNPIKRVAATIWSWFRSYSIFVQCLLIVPILFAIAFTLIVGNMGLALMGGAIALYGPVVGWIGATAALAVGKASAIVWRDRRRSR